MNALDRSSASRSSRHHPASGRQDLSIAASAASPLLATRLIGRESEVKEVLDAVAQTPVLTLTGPPGVGKSSLALRVARHLEEAAGQWVAIVRLASVETVADVRPALTDTLGAIPVERADGLLIVLDDCDRVAAACAEVAEELVSRGLRVLATSRGPLGAHGEAVWRVPPLSLPVHPAAELAALMGDSHAVQLFCERAAAADRNFVPTPSMAPVIAEICSCLDGVPLALELAARCVSVYTPAEIVARLQSPLCVLTGGVQTDHRHASVRAAIEWSYDQLSSPERALLERLSVFASPFTEEAAAEVCVAGMETAAEETSEILMALVHKSLVEAEPLTDAGSRRFRLLQTTKAYGAERLATREEGLTRHRHAAWCTRLIRDAGDSRGGGPWLDQLRPYNQEIDAALRWALTNGDAGRAVTLGMAYADLCRPDLATDEFRARLEPVVEAASAVPRAIGLRVMARAGVAELMAGRLQQAVARLEESVIAGTEAEEPGETARSGAVLAFARMMAGDAGALLELEAAVDKARKVDDPPILVDALATLARARLLVGDPAVAHDLFAEALDRAHAEGDEVGRSQALIGLGEASVFLGRYADADTALLEGAERAREIGELHATGVALAWRGESARLRGYPKAGDLFSAAAELARGAGHPYPLALALIGLGRVGLQADGVAARAVFEEAESIARRCPLPSLLAPCLCALAEMAADLHWARGLVDEALGTARSSGDKAGEALAYQTLGQLSYAEGEMGGAIALHRRALLLRREIGDPAATLQSLDALARAASTSSDFRMAARVFGAVDTLQERYGLALDSSMEDRLSAQQKARRALGDDTFDAERRRGAVLSTEAAVAFATRESGKRRHRPSTGWHALTPAERRVADVAAEGRTNAQISRRLAIAEATVKAHLRRVYAKLGVEGRAALAADLHRPGPAAGRAGPRSALPPRTSVRPSRGLIRRSAE